MTKHKTSIGGSALIEGVMMRGPSKMAIAVRKPDNEIELKVTDLNTKTGFLRKIPIVRGVFNFVDSMITSMRALMYSAEFVDIEDESENSNPGKFEKWLTEKLGDKLKDYLIYFSVFVALLFSVGLFFLLPMVIGDLTGFIFNDNFIARSFVEGVMRIVIFLCYLILCSKQSDVRRVFAYHGAEHKTIFCYEAGLALTVENCRAQDRLHPRCGTSFLMFVLIISIIVFSFVHIDTIWLRTVVKLLCLPIVAGISYELIRWAGRSENRLVQVISKPGLWLQRISTKEPDDQMLEVAIASLTAVLPKESEDDTW